MRMGANGTMLAIDGATHSSGRIMKTRNREILNEQSAGLSLKQPKFLNYRYQSLNA